MSAAGAGAGAGQVNNQRKKNIDTKLLEYLKLLQNPGRVSAIEQANILDSILENLSNTKSLSEILKQKYLFVYYLTIIERIFRKSIVGHLSLKENENAKNQINNFLGKMKLYQTKTDEVEEKIIQFWETKLKAAQEQAAAPAPPAAAFGYGKAAAPAPPAADFGYGKAVAPAPPAPAAAFGYGKAAAPAAPAQNENAPGEIPPRNYDGVDCKDEDGKEKKVTWYHSKKYCACTFVEFAQLLNQDIHNIQKKRNPVDRIDKCIEARKHQTNKKHQGIMDETHGYVIQKLNNLKEALKNKGNTIKNYRIGVDMYNKFYLENEIGIKTFVEGIQGGTRRKTRKVSHKKRKQTRRRR